LAVAFHPGLGAAATANADNDIGPAGNATITGFMAGTVTIALSCRIECG
jgi:hypothetical protein